jgi:hypothetical protein
MHFSSRSLTLQIEASDTLLEALAISSDAAKESLSRDQMFEIAALRYLVARALHIAARSCEVASD